MRFEKSVEFEWDSGTTDKNWLKHQISNNEGEEMFFDEDKVILNDILYSDKEDRFIILGKTKKQKILFVVYTKRKNKIRIISARIADKKERNLYEKSA